MSDEIAVNARPVCMAIIENKDYGCGKFGWELPYMVTEAYDERSLTAPVGELNDEEKLFVDKYVVREDETYNARNGHFLCDACFEKLPAKIIATTNDGEKWVAP